MNHPERVNALAAINQASRYLEIGVNRGSTFTQVAVENKVAVDPQFLFDWASLQTDKVSFHEVTSDEYFTHIISPNDKFDLIFLDGLHTFEQTFRDFCASLAHAHENTIWIIDDVCPVSWASASREQHQLSARVVRRLTGDRRLHWMGDVYKCVFAIHDFFPQFNFATFDGHGQTVVWQETRQPFQPTFDSMTEIAGLSYQGFQQLKDAHFKIADENTVLLNVSDGLNGRKRAA